jgi:hypothetical protein
VHQIPIVPAATAAGRERSEWGVDSAASSPYSIRHQDSIHQRAVHNGLCRGALALKNALKGASSARRRRGPRINGFGG